MNENNKKTNHFELEELEKPLTTEEMKQTTGGYGTLPRALQALFDQAEQQQARPPSSTPPALVDIGTIGQDLKGAKGISNVDESRVSGLKLTKATATNLNGIPGQLQPLK